MNLTHARRMSGACAVVFVMAMLSACTQTAAEGKESGDKPGHTQAEQESATNRVDIPPAVRNNLGITFARVEVRNVAATIRVPGRFELIPTARREYRTMLPGRVELLVQQFDRVDPGTPLYTIDSPAWRDLQLQLSDATNAVDRLVVKEKTIHPLMAAHEDHELSLQDVVWIWGKRIDELEIIAEAGGGRASDLAAARAALATAQADLADVKEKDATLIALRAEIQADLAAARSRLAFLLQSAASLVGMPVNDGDSLTESDLDQMPWWATIDRITVSATDGGVIETLELTNGAWADEKAAVLTIVQPDRLRFHAQGLQSDMRVLRDGLPARIAGDLDDPETMTGELFIGWKGDPEDRTVDLYLTPQTIASWARAGISAHLEVDTASTKEPELAIPLAAVVRDGLMPIIFRRDPANPDKAIRMEADLGVADGRWVVINSGVKQGDEIVLSGVYQLLLATADSMAKGGHFHADGTFHAGEDE